MTQIAAPKRSFLELNPLQYSISNAVRTLQYNQSCREVVQQAMADFRDCLIFDKAIPWMDTSLNSMGNAILPALSSCPLESAGSFGAYLPTLTTKCACVRPSEEWQAFGRWVEKVTGIQVRFFATRTLYFCLGNKRRCSTALGHLLKTGAKKWKTFFKKLLEGEIPCDKVFENEHIIALKT